MLQFRRLDIIIAEPGSPTSAARVMVCWELVTQHSGLGEVTFAVERSQSPQFSDDEYEVIEPAIAGGEGQFVYQYDDITPNLISTWRRYYYRIRAETPHGSVVSETRTWETSPRPHELAIIERHDFVLRYLQGKPSFAFVERTADAARCICYDATAGRVTRSDCTLCMGTGRQRPYFAPIKMFVDYNPDEKLVQISGFGEVHINQKDCWFSAFPQCKPGDLIYEVMTGLLWRIEKLNTIQPMGTTIQHVARLGVLDRSEVEYRRLVQQISPDTLRELVREWEEIKSERLF